MRTLLEEAFERLLNNDQKGAEDFLHQFMVKKARAIHESLRSEEDILDEEYYVESDPDLEVADDTTVDSTDGDQDDLSVDDATDDLSDDVGTEPVEGDEVEGDVTGGEVPADIDERFDDIDEQLAKLSQELEELLGKDTDLDADVDTTLDDDQSLDTSSEPVEDDMNDDTSGEEATVEEGFGDDEFDDITESILNDLEKISFSNEDGKEVGTGKKIANKDGKSTITGSDLRDKNKPTPVDFGKGDKHSGFEREKSPVVKDIKVKDQAKANKAKDLGNVVVPKNTLMSTKPNLK